MKVILLMIFSAFLLACKKDAMPSQAGQLNYLALGDSYTIGEGVPQNERWPNQLAEKLKAQGENYADPKIIAKTGWTTDELNRAIDNAAIKEKYDLVSLLIGVNNQFRGRDTTNFRIEFKILLNRAIGFSNKKVIVISIPDWGVTPYAKNSNKAQIAKEIDIFNAIIKEESKKLNIPFFDITPISRKAEKDASLIANDGLHPSGKMYAEWVNLIVSKL